MRQIAITFALAIYLSHSIARDGSSLEVVEPTEAQRKYIGRTFYLPLSLNRCRHPHSFSIVLTPNVFDTNRIVQNSGLTFTVESIVRGENGANSRYLKIVLADGRVGFIDTLHFRVGDPSNDNSVRSSCAFEFTDNDSERRTRAAESLELAQQRQEEAAIAQSRANRELAEIRQAEVSRRPGARIGMTPREVRTKTNWGEPDHINRTVTTSGTFEQWVYGDGEYLYFSNGRLTSIQTSLAR